MPRPARTILRLAPLVLLALLGAGAPPIVSEPVPEDPENEETSTPLPPIEVEPDPWLGEDEPLLAGPRLSEEQEGRTLVRFEFRGNLRRLDRTPEEAALDALNLPGPDRDKADEIVLRRRAALDRCVRGDLQILLALQAARQAGTKPESEPLAEALLDRIATMSGPIRFRDEIAESLPESARRDFQRMIDEYWRALVLDEVQQARNRRETLTLVAARVRVTLNTAANELRRAFERQYQPRERVLDVLVLELDLSADQEKKVTEPLRALADRTRSQPSAREAYDLTTKVLPYLNAEQRQVWSVVLFGVSPLDTPSPSGLP